MRVAEILSTNILPDSPTSRLDLELLLAEALNKNRSFLYAHPESKLTRQQDEKFKVLYQRRLQGEPLAYILGKKEFWSLAFMVNENVLIPRPETEILVEIILQKINYQSANIADMGTGSGAIALALAYERPHWNIVATDISEGALQVACYNALRFQLQNVEFCCGDWCNVLPDRKFDVIVSNPPYIDIKDRHLQEGDVRFEPKIALEAKDGLNALKKIITQAKSKLKSGGLLVLEHGYDQSDSVQNLLQQNNYQKIVVYKDLSGISRAVTGTNL